MDRFARTVWFVVIIFVGCGKPAPAVDDTPFRAAIGQYLQANNMAMKIKEIKQGPTIAGENAMLQASLTHEQLVGPSVTWEFEFVRQPDKSWRVTRHQDRK